MADVKFRPSQKKRAHIRDIKYSGDARNSHCIMCEHGTTIEEAMDPGFAWHGHARIKAGDLLEIGHENHKFYARLYVIKVDPETQSIFSRVMEQHDWSGDAVPVADLSEARVEFKGKAEKWCVILGVVKLSIGHKEKADAEEWLDERRTSPMQRVSEPA